MKKQVWLPKIQNLPHPLANSLGDSLYYCLYYKSFITANKETRAIEELIIEHNLCLEDAQEVVEYIKNNF